MVSVPANDRGGLMSVQVIHGDVGVVTYNGCSFNVVEGNGVQNLSGRELSESKAVSKDGDVYMRQLMTIYQLNKSGKVTGNKGVIDALCSKKLGLVFDSDELENRILHSDENPMLKGYVVDVVMLTANGKPAAYKIIGLHDVIDLE